MDVKLQCLICCNELDILGIGSECEHDALTCWKCAYIIQQYNKEKNCPTCKNSLETVKYVDVSTYLSSEGMKGIDYVQHSENELNILTGDMTKDNHIKALYENQQVKMYIYHCTAPYCYDCDIEFRKYIEYKKHIEVKHRQYICELCLKHRHCVLSDLQIFDTRSELLAHLNGKNSEDVSTNHQKCMFCGTYHDDRPALKKHYMDDHRICDFCKVKAKRDTDFVFKEYKEFMVHSKNNHLVCEIGECDCVFDNVTTMDLHQAEFHGKSQLRIRTKEDHERETEENKKPEVTQVQYERMNKKKKEHFPTLSGGQNYNYADEEGKDKGNNNKKNKVDKHAPYGSGANRKVLGHEGNFPTLEGGPLKDTISKEEPRERRKPDYTEFKESTKKKNRKAVVEPEKVTESPEDAKKRRDEEKEFKRLMKESVKESLQNEVPRVAHTSHNDRPTYNTEPL
jgi:hypothetical protein